MEQVPQEFAKRLQDEFDGRYRLRWSNKFHEWHLEQKVGQGEADPPFYIDGADDTMIRARDGYWLVMTIQPGDRMACRARVDGATCGATVKVPIMETREAVCEVCRRAGRDGRHATAYWPLNDALIQHIRRIDALLGHNETLKAELDAANEVLMATAQKDALNDIEAVSYEIRKTLGGIEQIGYGRSIIRPVSGRIS